MNFVRVGKIKDAHGIRGELFVVLFAGEAEWLPKLKELRLVKEASGANVRDGLTGGASTSDGTAQTFSVKSARAHKNGLIVKSADIKDRNHAETLKGLIVEIPDDFLVSEPGESIFLREIQGFTVKNSGATVGVITKFSSNVAQDLLVVETPQGEFEIPFVDAFVKNIDYAGKVIEMDLPYGLLGEADTEEEIQDGQDDGSDDE